MAVAGVALALCVAAPELAAPVGAATPTASGTTASRPNGHVVLVARRRSRAERRRARVAAYLKSHPKAAARKLAAHPALYARALRKKGIPAKLPKARTAAKHKKKARHAKVSKKVRRRRAAAAAAKKKRRRRAGAAAVGAKRHKKAKKSKSSGHHLSGIDWLEIALLVLAPFAAVALLLYITDVRRRPRAPSRSKRRRSLVITPLNKS
jgi:hypothetical protein